MTALQAPDLLASKAGALALGDGFSMLTQFWSAAGWGDLAAWRGWHMIRELPTWAFDVLFYNVSRIPPDLWNDCGFQRAPEDSIMVIKRTRDRSASYGRKFNLSCYKGITEIPQAEIDAIGTVTLAGVGSSALGAVALAIDVADAIAEQVRDDTLTVAAIVTGQGGRNVLQEAIGGWYVLGEANINRQRLLGFSDIVKVWLDRNLGVPTKVSDQMDLFAQIAARMDLDLPESTLVSEFIKSAKALRLVVGHSKGCLYLNNALSKIADDAHGDSGKEKELAQIARRLTIVTLGAVIFTPAEFENSIHQYIGEYDALGALNSRQRMKHTVVPGVMHHLNTAIPMHMNCRKVLESDQIVVGTEPSE
ncbi:hypothetical protein QZM22_30635 [Burkholderia oklahomensis]|uniref:hypothetical protein n=1 Tax=Burkholderia oklahomensis TaxID=342113 RepID=UPI00264E7002|nr:hypothetical protein [Burkholderia oklahomensis]MDN7676719.1 hypothetical protein [Burkholderia oklahomensis]